jgi:hypothetical protein
MVKGRLAKNSFVQVNAFVDESTSSRLSVAASLYSRRYHLLCAFLARAASSSALASNFHFRMNLARSLSSAIALWSDQ